MVRPPARVHALRPSLPVVPVEWVGGVITMPGYVTGDGEPFRPEAAFWLTADGPIGMVLGRPGEPVVRLLEAFEVATSQPMMGAPHRPARVRVAGAEVAAALRAALGEGIEVVCAPTPEIDAVAASMGEFLDQQGPGADPSFLDAGSTAEAMASFFRSAAKLFRAAPWDIIPDSGSIVSVTCEALGLRQAAVSVMGQLRQQFGFLCLASYADFEQYVALAALAGESGERPAQMPPQLALTFDPGSSLDPGLRKEISRHGWEVASAKAYPSLVSVDRDLIGRPPTREELARVEVIALALVELVRSSPQLASLWDRGETLVRTFTVAAHGGDVAVTVRVPHEALGLVGADDLRAAGQGLHVEQRDASGALDPGWYASYKQTLLAGFDASPEAAPLDEVGWADVLLDLATQSLDVTMAGLTPRHLVNILFGLIPREVSVEASEAPVLVAELDAFLSFLERAHGLGNLAACLRELRKTTTVTKLTRELSDTSNFGPAKAFVMQGQAEGFDLSTEEGVAAWVATVRARQGLAAAPGKPGRTQATKGASRTKAPAKKAPAVAKKAPAKKAPPTAKKAVKSTARGKSTTGPATAGKTRRKPT